MGSNPLALALAAALAAGGDRPPHTDLPRERRACSRARGEEAHDRRADGPGQPPGAARRPRGLAARASAPGDHVLVALSTSTASSSTTTPSAIRPATRSSAGLGTAWRLRGRRGRAYRMGGDEFCVLSTPRDDRCRSWSPEPPRAVASTATGSPSAAPTAVVTLPDGDRDAADALRIADQRMYAAEARAAARPPAARADDVLLRALREPPDLGATSPASPRSGAPSRPARAAAEDVERDPPGGRAARRRQDRDPRRHPRQARPARREDEWEFVQRHTLIGERIIAGRARAARASPARPLEPRALGRHAATRTAWPARHPARRADRRRLRRLRRDDHRAPLPRRPHAGGGARRARAAAPARSSTRSWSRLPRQRVVVASTSPSPPDSEGAPLPLDGAPQDPLALRARYCPAAMAAGTDALQRTPLYDRHVAAAPSRPVRALGDARLVQRHPSRAPGGAERRRPLRRLRTWASWR